MSTGARRDDAQRRDVLMTHGIPDAASSTAAAPETQVFGHDAAPSNGRVRLSVWRMLNTTSTRDGMPRRPHDVLSIVDDAATEDVGDIGAGRSAARVSLGPHDVSAIVDNVVGTTARAVATAAVDDVNGGTPTSIAASKDSVAAWRERLRTAAAQGLAELLESIERQEPDPVPEPSLSAQTALGAAYARESGVVRTALNARLLGRDIAAGVTMNIGDDGVAPLSLGTVRKVIIDLLRTYSLAARELMTAERALTAALDGVSAIVAAADILADAAAHSAATTPTLLVVGDAIAQHVHATLTARELPACTRRVIVARARLAALREVVTLASVGGRDGAADAATTATTAATATAAASPVCPVCMTAPVAHALTPCGHAYCGECATAMRRRGCALCRAPVSGLLRIYFA